MPYRRLPNTDAARTKAMGDALTKSMRISPFDLAFSYQSLQRVKTFRPLFEQAMQRQKAAYKNQVDKGKLYNEYSRKARLYISHFLQVMNFMVLRGELPDNTRRFYGLSTSTRSLPNLSTDAELLEWGRIIIDGDMERLKAGGKMITNPTAAVVKVHYEKFAQAYHLQRTLQKISNQTLSKLASMREEADKIILTIWNEVEAKFKDLTDEEKRQHASEYGLKYVYRPHEKQKIKKLSVAEERALRFTNGGKTETKKQESPQEEKEKNPKLNQLSLFSNN